jgi:hypothetical protein
MPRPVERTHTLPLTLTEPMLTLFGSAPNAHVHLGLRKEIDAVNFARAIRSMPVTEEVATLVQDAIRSWRRQFVLGTTQGRDVSSFIRLTDAEETALLKEYAPTFKKARAR